MDVVIAAYDCADTIGPAVLASVRGIGRVIVVDDKSSDDSGLQSADERGCHGRAARVAGKGEAITPRPRLCRLRQGNPL